MRENMELEKDITHTVLETAERDGEREGKGRGGRRGGGGEREREGGRMVELEEQGE